MSEPKGRVDLDKTRERLVQLGLEHAAEQLVFQEPVNFRRFSDSIRRRGTTTDKATRLLKREAGDRRATATELRKLTGS